MTRKEHERARNNVKGRETPSRPFVAFRALSWACALFVLLLGLSACGLFSPRKPAIVILAPPAATEFREGETVSVQSTATDASGITRVELAVDGTVVRTDGPPTPVQQFRVTQTWQATAGQHTITVRAYNAANVGSDPAIVEVAVLGPSFAAAPRLTPDLESTPIPSAPPGACTDDAEFVADVTIPDGTVLLARQSFEKIWRVRNTGTCTWTGNYQFTLLSGQVMAITPIGVPATAPGRMADLRVPMTAPLAPGTYSSFWRMRNPGGAFFGVTVNVTIRVANGPAACAGAPNIASFAASPATITAGQSATLTWGLVTNAESAVIDNGIGGIATPGNRVVAPTTTTTYTLTARCGTIIRTAQVTITVNPAPTATPTLTPLVPTATPSPTATTTPTTIPPTVTATPTATLATKTITRCFIAGESGEAIKSGTARAVSPLPQVGDDAANNTHRAFFSFDIQAIGGKIVDSATLNVSGVATQGNPLALAPLVAQQVAYSPPVTGAAYDLPGTNVFRTNTSPVGAYNVKSELQAAATAGRTRFQLRLQLNGETNSNNTNDLFAWPLAADVCLNITYH
ncbi:MAG: hypothetical protein HY782_04580 [Chloroflexi bacterium]|nr:hypothetical protein [Chloroflexota bacterium]